ncbi:hypothetical protein L6386_04240 [bacterium]|nr:hypothetical protein [bacterium]MCG2676230.1 hypothetical protein [bacterium]MCG2677747.1 hypothetical protein [bacterium]
MKKLLCTLIVLFLFPFLAHSKSFELRSRNEYIHGLSSTHKDEVQYANKISLNWRFKLEKINRTLRIAPYTEITYNFETDELNKTESGLEVELEIVKYLNFYSAFQYATINKHHDYICTGEDKINWELLNGIIFSIPTPLKIAKRPIRFQAVETYIYDLDNHRGTRNELEGGLFWKAHKHLDLGIKWRHIDHIHYTDVDELAGVVTLVF